MMKPLVSICSITYNHEKYIAQAIEGFVGQKTTFPFEIIIHDDASTDKTPQIVKYYENKYPELIKPIYQKENQFSKGIKPSPTYVWPKAQGKYIALCEGDDYWTDPYKLQKQVDFLELNPDYAMCWHDAMSINEKGKVITKSRLVRYSKESVFSEIELMKGVSVLTMTVLFKNISSSIPNEFYMVLNGDTFLFSMMGMFGKGMYMKDILPAVYRIHDGGVWSKKSDVMKKYNIVNTYAWLSKYYKRISNEEISEYFKNQFYKCFYELIERPPYGSKAEIGEKIGYLFKRHVDLMDDFFLRNFFSRRINVFYANTIGFVKYLRSIFIYRTRIGNEFRDYIYKIKCYNNFFND
jgi:glycosyltransferase involved in cell wall biosynthesis